MTGSPVVTTEISIKHLQLLKHTIDVQDRMLDGCLAIFSGLTCSEVPEVVSISEQALQAIKDNRLVLEALIDGINQTRH